MDFLKALAKTLFIWAITNNGIYEVSDKACSTAHYWAQANENNFKIPFADLYDLYEDKNGVSLMATNGGGLIRWNRANHTSEQYTTEDGLSSNILYAVLQDDKGFIWMRSEYGLMRFDPVTKYVKTYTTDDGLTDNEFILASSLKGIDGTLYFGGQNGVNAFHPKEFWKDTVRLDVAPVVLLASPQARCLRGGGGCLIDVEG